MRCGELRWREAVGRWGGAWRVAVGGLGCIGGDGGDGAWIVWRWTACGRGEVLKRGRVEVRRWRAGVGIAGA